MTRLISVATTCIPKLALLLLALLAAGCRREPAGLEDLFPEAGALVGWKPAGQVEVFDRETLYDLVNGQAESFFAFGFERAAVRSYEGAAGATLRITVWQLAAPADAYGLFTASRSGVPADVGNEGDADPGRRVIFWQDRYLADLFASPALPEADLLALAQAASARLPSGGERPALTDRLPAGGLVPRSEVFFHQEISIQGTLWLGGENLLGLSPQTDGLLARYERGGAAVWLLLVLYPDAEAASAGLAALEGGQVGGLVAAGVQDGLLGAAFGQADAATAGELLSEALGGG